MNTLTLESLLLLFAQSNERLSYYKISNEDEEMAQMYQGIIKLLQNAISEKRSLN